MSPPVVIEHFDVVEQLHFRVPVAVEVLAELALDRREEAFHHRVVVAVAAPAHAAHDAAHRYCQVDEKLVERPPRYWARVSREPAMLGDQKRPLAST